jgi:hypothetical protein
MEGFFMDSRFRTSTSQISVRVLFEELPLLSVYLQNADFYD